MGSNRVATDRSETDRPGGTQSYKSLTFIYSVIARERVGNTGLRVTDS